jgi:5,6-dimethylbenzimidazole synthase
MCVCRISGLKVSGFELSVIMNNQPPVFDESFINKFVDLVKWRRDVRRFRPDPVNEALLASLINLASFSPSVGYSQPWRFMRVQDETRRSAVRENFLVCNKAALDSYEGERAELYARLKLEGLDTAPEHVAVFCDMDTTVGHGLGLRTMPEMREYSTVIACHTLWLASRAHGLGMGWVSILNPVEISKILGVPSAWKFIAYLSIGYPLEQHEDPELQRHGWEHYRQSEFLTR